MSIQLLLEAFGVGIVTIIFGNIIGYIISKFFVKTNLPTECKNWNKYHIMEITLFLTGFFIHIIFEFLGLNMIYCQYKIKSLKNERPQK